MNKRPEELTSYQNKKVGRLLLDRVKESAEKLKEKTGKKPLLMEVCGTHTMAFSRTGLRKALEDLVDLRSGPGCPVCVAGQSDIDMIIELSKQENIVIATFGDLLRVPGSKSSLEQEKARGAKVEIFYSPADAVAYARENSSQQVVFIGIGFETTSPMVALSVKEAAALKVGNYSVLSLHKVVPPGLRALLADDDIKIDGFILPGHASAVTGRKAFAFLGEEYLIPSVIAGFEPLDLIEVIDNLVLQLLEGSARVENNHKRLVKEEGNIAAQAVMAECFDMADAFWRGVGVIPGSGMVFKKHLSGFDAAKRFQVEVPPPQIHPSCRCGEIISGKMVPKNCPAFGRACTPAQPLGPCMVSSEGACAAYYHYENMQD